MMKHGSSSKSDYNKEAHKEKKHKRHKERRRHSSDSDDQRRDKKKGNKKMRRHSTSASSSSDEWEEKRSDVKEAAYKRDDWMNVEALVPATARKKEIREPKHVNKCIIAAPGQSERELNPYWKNGGCGLPTEKKDLAVASHSVGDSGGNWYERALERAKETAKAEGRSLEDVVSERWVSLEKLEGLIADAKLKSNRDRYDHRSSHRRESRDYASRKSRQDDEEKRRPVFKKPGDEFGREYSRRAVESRGGWRKNKNEREEHVRREHSDTPVTSRECPQKTATNEDTKVPNFSEESFRDQETQERSFKSDKKNTLTDEELNSLAAKLVKAEILGNASLIEKLKNKISEARKDREEAKSATKSGSAKEETIILMTTNEKGLTRPVQGVAHREPKGGRRKTKKTETHNAGQRVRYFPDDDNRDLKEMFEKEKLSSADDDKALFLKLSARKSKYAGSDEEDAAFADAARFKESDGKVQEREHNRAVHEEVKRRKVLDGCSWCLDNTQCSKHLIVSVGETCYLCLPAEESLTPMHCLLVPIQHVTCGTLLDENVWEEIHKYKKGLIAMAESHGKDIILFEQARALRSSPHMVLHCVILDKEIGDLAPIYFKKAILDSESEWATNKKVVDIKGSDVRRSIPKGLPYFSVQFGSSGGFAHVIEDEKLFPWNFAHSVIGGMLDLDHVTWRKPRKTSIEAQREKTITFTKQWKKFDFAVPKKRRRSSSSESSSSSSDSSSSS